ncbi:MAG: transcriptional repressor [Streptosporangiales bacterium]|nr:transcriptional repressor [Streptosporangiales bacterium]
MSYGRTAVPTASRNADPESRTRRRTRQGSLVTEALGRADEFQSAQEVFATLRANGHNIGLTTVYRHLTDLAERGAVDVLRSADGENWYRQCEIEAHHHHLVCRSCGRTVEIKSSSVEKWAQRVAEAEGFSEVSHTVEVFGLCSACSR